MWTHNSQQTTVAEGSDQYGLENNGPVQWKSQCNFPHYMYYLHYHNLSCT